MQEVAPSQLHVRFRIDAELARGGMGAVFSALDNATGQRVALKRLSPDAPREARALFEREYCVLSSLRHPRIIEVFEYGLDAEVIGAIAVCGGHNYRPISHALLGELGLQLYGAGDMISARTLS